MAMADAFNTAAHASVGVTTATLSAELLEILQRKRDGNSDNLGLNERAIELIQQGASLTATDDTHKRTALMWASIHCRAKVLDEILPRTKNPLVTDADGKTALDHAREHKHKPAIERLEKAESAYRQRLLAEAQDVTTKRDTKIMRTLVLKKTVGQNGGKS